jgi:micrococcal nuclease
MKAQYSRKAILGVIGFVVATGGYGGYMVVQKYGAGFDTHPHIVVRVVDGDTIEVEEKIKVRLTGVNAPDRGECYFEESKMMLEALIAGGQVVTEKDSTGKDRYGRFLRYLMIPSDTPEENDLFVNNELVRRGAAFAKSIAPDTKYRDLFATSQREAKESGSGLWGACAY